MSLKECRTLAVITACACVTYVTLFYFNLLPGTSGKVTIIGREQGLPTPSPNVENFIPSVFWKNVSTRTGYQRVREFVEPFFVYSAYSEMGRRNAAVRVFGVTVTNFTRLVKCTFYDEEAEVIDVGHAWISRIFNVVYHITYSAFSAVCEHTTIKRPAYVSLSPIGGPSGLTSAIVTITYAVSLNSTDIGICMKPTQNYNDVSRVYEWLEFHQMMGVAHFTVYNYNNTIGKELLCLLESYSNVDVLPIQSLFGDLDYNVALLDNGGLVSLNDCVYRYRGVTKYVLMIDFDEFIIPNGDFEGYVDYILWLNRKLVLQEDRVGAYIFQNAFYIVKFRGHPGNTGTNSGNEFPLNNISQHLILRNKIRRNVEFQHHVVRSKYICRPETVKLASYHFVIEHVRGYSSVNVSAVFGTSHHYRDGCPDPEICRQRKLKDRSGVSYGEKLKRRLEARNENTLQRLC